MSLIPIAGNNLADRIASTLISNPGLLLVSAAAVTGVATNMISTAFRFSGLHQAVLIGSGTALFAFAAYELHTKIIPELAEMVHDEIRIATLQEATKLSGSIETLSYVYVAGMATVLVIYMLK